MKKLSFVILMFILSSVGAAESQLKITQYYQPVQGILCEQGAHMNSCRPMNGETSRAIYNDNVYEISPESGLVILL